jgi:hypothetical protein
MTCYSRGMTTTEETVKWLRDRAEEHRGDQGIRALYGSDRSDAAAKDCDEMADLAERRAR